jgi:hypothetical protein
VIETITTIAGSITITLIGVKLYSKYQKRRELKNFLSRKSIEGWQNFYAKAEAIRRKTEVERRERERSRSERLDELTREL